LGAFGDAGMIVTNDPELAEKMRIIRTHGSKHKYIHDILGYNSRLDELQAAILNVKFPYLDSWNRLRREKALYYTSMLEENVSNAIVTPYEKEGNYHIYHQYTIRANRRDELQSYLQTHGISTIVYYPLPLHLQPVFSDLGYKEGDLPHTERAAKEVLSLPIFPELSESQQDYVVSKIVAFYKN
jgi:dTDP-4-amino-4,6-dideoxygalactose transaminase